MNKTIKKEKLVDWLKNFDVKKHSLQEVLLYHWIREKKKKKRTKWEEY